MVAAVVLGLVSLACSGGDEGGGADLSADTTASTPSTTSTASNAAGEDATGSTTAGADGASEEPATIVVGGDDDTPAPGEGDGAAEAGATSAAETAEAIEALEGDELEEFLARRYESFWKVYGEARQMPTANPAVDFPALADLAVGEQLEAAYAELEDMATSGRALRDPAERAVPGLDADSAHRVRVEQVDGGAATLVACFVNDRQSVRVDDGAVINDLVVTVQAEATMVRTDDTWKLVRSQAVALDQGVAGCWLEDESLYPW